MSRRWASLGWFGGALALFCVTAARGPMWADSSKLTLYALHGYWPSLNPGDHPGWTLLAGGWLAAWPGSDPVLALTLLSATAAATAVALMFATVSGQTGDRARGHSAAAVLLTAHPLWWAATVAETYAAAVALVLLVALLSTSRAGLGRAVAAGLAAGLALAVHAFTAFLTLPLLLAVPRRRWLTALVALLVGGAPIWLGIVWSPADPLTGHQSAGSGSWGWHLAQFLDPARAARGAGIVLALLLYAVGPLGAWTTIRAWGSERPSAHPRPRYGAIATAILTLVLAFYSPFRIHLMVLLPLVAVLLLAPPRLSPRLRVAQPSLQALLYVAAPFALATVGLSTLGARQLPERDNASYFLSPIKAFERGPERYARALLDACPPHAVVLADFNPGAVLRLVQQREMRRPDVMIVPTAIDEALADRDPVGRLATRLLTLAEEGRPVVLADRWEPYYRVTELARRGFSFVPNGPGLAVAPSARPGR